MAEVSPVPDIQRVTMPAVNGSVPVQQRGLQEGIDAFSLDVLTELSKKDGAAGADSARNDGMYEGRLTPALLLEMLKDPEKTVSWIKNLNVLLTFAQEKPDAVGSSADTLAQLPEEVKAELMAQENGSTSFRGALFDFLRAVSENHSSEPETQTAIAELMRSLYGAGNQSELSASTANYLSFLQNAVIPDTRFNEKLDALISDFKSPEKQANVQELRARTLGLLMELENSGTIKKSAVETLSVIRYNLSRVGVCSEDALENAIKLFNRLNTAEKSRFSELFEAYTGVSGDAQKSEPSESRAAQTLAALFTGRTEPDILRSMLMTPESYVPLLHFFLPLSFGETRAAAELWADPEGGGSSQEHSGGAHVLLVIEIEDMGRFEAEFYLKNDALDFTLYCPEGSADGYAVLLRDMPKLLYDTPYRLGRARTAELNRTRSLSEVFGTLPRRRVGVDVKI